MAHIFCVPYIWNANNSKAVSSEKSQFLFSPLSLIIVLLFQFDTVDPLVSLAKLETVFHCES